MFVVTWKEAPYYPVEKRIFDNDLPNSQICPNLEEVKDILQNMRDVELLDIRNVRIYDLTKQAPIAI